MPIQTAFVGNNADLIAALTELYVADGDLVLDMTYGKGVFWRKTDLTRFKLVTNDLETPADYNCDFRHLPLIDATFDMVVLDPPYVHNPGNHVTDARYGNHTTEGMYHDDILELYVGGMTEAQRLLKPYGGRLVVKCKDEVESGVQRWSHIEIFEAAIGLGFFARDLFVLMPTSKTSDKRWDRQIHARKNHSFAWVFELPDPGYAKALVRAGWKGMDHDGGDQ